MSQMKDVFSIDVEDWFHILGLPTASPIEKWKALESRVENNFYGLLDLLDETNTKATCFILGWVAENFPQVVREAKKRGHEVASHGYGHQLITHQSREEFAADIRKAKSILEEITGDPVLGYRAPSFSVTPETIWALEELVKAGFKYDSSIFPTSRGNGGIIGARKDPHLLNTPAGPIKEFPISVASFMGKELCFFGGGYLRLFPYSLIRKMSEKVSQEGRPVVYYIHPREIDVSHPRMEMSAVKRFKSYVNLGTTKEKLRSILRDRELTTFMSILEARELWSGRGRLEPLKQAMNRKF